MSFVVKRNGEYFKEFSCTSTDRVWTWTIRQKDAWHFAQYAQALGWATDASADVVRLIRKRSTSAQPEKP